jgi:hypothetical protein
MENNDHEFPFERLVPPEQRDGDYYLALSAWSDAQISASPPSVYLGSGVICVYVLTFLFLRSVFRKGGSCLRR